MRRERGRTNQLPACNCRFIFSDVPFQTCTSLTSMPFRLHVCNPNRNIHTHIFDNGYETDQDEAIIFYAWWNRIGECHHHYETTLCREKEIQGFRSLQVAEWCRCRREDDDAMSLFGNDVTRMLSKNSSSIKMAVAHNNNSSIRSNQCLALQLLVGLSLCSRVVLRHVSVED